MKRLYRCRWDKKIGGVCGGLGQYFRMDPTVIRMIFVIIATMTAVIPCVIVYALLWIFLPLGPSIYVQIPGKKFYRSKTDRKIAGVCGGIANYLFLNSNFVRILTLALTIATGGVPLIITYIAGSVIIPENPDEPF